VDLSHCLRLDMLDGVQNFEREVVATGGKFSDRAAY
jgi:hypothetical protein